MQIKTVHFVKSSAIHTQCPKDDKPSVALMGRSNVGKSSLINGLLGHKGLAKTSGKPGKTQLINHFLINDNWYLVDLPGYGWAQVSQQKRKQWTKMVRQYLVHDTRLLNVLLLMDARHPLQRIDLDCLHWLYQQRIPFIVLLTKADKLTKQVLYRQVQAVQHSVQEELMGELPLCLATSSKNRTGCKEALQYVQRLLGESV